MTFSTDCTRPAIPVDRDRSLRRLKAKLLVLTLPGFAARNDQPIGVTDFRFMLLGAMFMRGFREVVVVGIYSALNAVVIGSGSPENSP